MSRFRSVLATLATAIVILAAPATASATEVLRFRTPIDDTLPGFITCDGFDVGLRTIGVIDVTVQLDDAGEPQRFFVRTNLVDTATNSVTGAQLVNRGVFEQMFVRIDGTDEFTHQLVGFRFMATRAGEGLLMQDVGRIVYSQNEESILFLAGQHHVDDSDITFICQFLA
jgi:hypothetical protein